MCFAVRSTTGAMGSSTSKRSRLSVRPADIAMAGARSGNSGGLRPVSCSQGWAHA
jgi:hypothetical protein